MNDDHYELVVSDPAVRAIADEIPEPVAVAVVDFITGVLHEDPRRVGRSLRNELVGIYSARRGTYRILYRVDDVAHEVIVLRVEHRSTIYRRR